MPVPGIIGCFDCSGTDHWASECPEHQPVTTKAGHEARIAKYLQWWESERITTAQKRQLISDENKRFYGRDLRPMMTK